MDEAEAGQWETVGFFRTSDSPKDPEDAALVVAANLEGVPASERTSRGAYRCRVIGRHEQYVTVDGKYRCRRVGGSKAWLLERLVEERWKGSRGLRLG